MVDYVSENGITDIVFANNVFKAYAGGKQYQRFLTQRGSGIYTPRPQQPDSVIHHADSLPATTDTLAVKAPNGTVFEADTTKVTTNIE